MVINKNGERIQMIPKQKDKGNCWTSKVLTNAGYDRITQHTAWRSASPRWTTTPNCHSPFALFDHNGYTQAVHEFNRSIEQHTAGMPWFRLQNSSLSMDAMNLPKVSLPYGLL